MNIAIIAWGSLVWKPGSLQFSESDCEWHNDGPVLPLEFSRISMDGRLTLVLDPAGKTLQTLHRKSSRSRLTDAIADLKKREDTASQYIGYVGLDDETTSLMNYPNQFNVHDTVKRWLIEGEIYEAAVWTALPPNFKEKRGVPFTSDSALEYLRSLPELVRGCALEYIRKAPAQIVTAFRRHLLSRNL